MVTSKDIEDVRLRFGSRVRSMREERQLSQFTFGHMVGLDRSYISSVENGHRNVSLDNIVRIAVGLGVTVSELTRGIDIACLCQDHTEDVEF